MKLLETSSRLIFKLKTKLKKKNNKLKKVLIKSLKIYFIILLIN